MILYKYSKLKVRSPDGDTDYFVIVASLLQGDTLAPYLFIICVDYVLRTSIDKIKENGFKLTKERIRRYPSKNITDTDYADDIALLANAPVQAETLLRSQERVASVIGLHVNACKMDYMCFNQTGEISTLDCDTLKLVDRFTYLGSSVSSTKIDIDTQQAKAWTAIDKLSVICKSDLTIKWNAFSSKQRSCQYCYMDALHGCYQREWRKHQTSTTQLCCDQYWTCSSSYTATNHPLWKLSKLYEPVMWDTAGEVGMSS